MESCALAGSTGDGNIAAGIANQITADAQSKADSIMLLAIVGDSLSRYKRLKNSRYDLLRYAGACVFDDNAHR